MPVRRAIESLAGLQAEDTVSPYVALAVRVADFKRDELTRALNAYRVVRVPAMRSTLHLLTADDYLAVAEALRPAHFAALRRYNRDAWNHPAVKAIAERALELTTDAPRTLGELGALLVHMLGEGADDSMVRWTARAYVPLVGVPPSGTWKVRAAPRYAHAETVLKRAVGPADAGLERLVRRYLAAFGPATRPDVEAWSGIPALGKPLAAMSLDTFRDEQGRVLYDVTRAPLPDAGTPAPPRLIARADNLVLSHADRTRVLPKQYASPIIRMGRMRAAFLVDGLVRGYWETKRSKRRAEIVLTAFEPVPKAAQRGVEEEARHVLGFIEDEADAYDIRMVSV